jgi:hypothetical protein
MVLAAQLFAMLVSCLERIKYCKRIGGQTLEIIQFIYKIFMLEYKTNNVINTFKSFLSKC